MNDLCEDEGCPHHGTPHVCVSPEERAREILIAEYRRRGWLVSVQGLEHGHQTCHDDATLAAIATALREAEARGLERALSAAMAAVDDEPLSCRKRVAAAIRAEKERTP